MKLHGGALRYAIFVVYEQPKSASKGVENVNEYVEANSMQCYKSTPNSLVHSVPKIFHKLQI